MRKMIMAFLSMTLSVPLLAVGIKSILSKETDVTVKQTPYIRKDGYQEARLSIKNSVKKFYGYYRVSMGRMPPYVLPLGKIGFGKSDFEILLTDTNHMLKPGETIALKIELFNNEACRGTVMASYENQKFERTRHWEIYHSQTMHTDLGYTDYQEDLRPLFSTFLDTVKQYMKNSDLRESDVQKYKYAIESGWVMGEGYMTQRNAEEIEELLDLMKAGRMTIGAGRFNYTTECFSTEETARAAYYTNRYLVDKLGIDPSTTQRMFDNPAFSKSYVDAAASAGIKYGIHSMNPDRSPYHKKKLYDLFYMEGMNPDNKLLIFNGKTYGDNYGFGGDHAQPDYGSGDIARKTILNLIAELEARTGRLLYPYDKFPMPLIPYGDNKQPMELPVKVANDLNKGWEEKGYVYPRVTMAFPETFFKEVEAEYAHMIPTEKGTEENWWNDGWGTTAYESGINKQAGSLVPVAETATSFSSLLAGTPYPYEDLYTATERNLIYDEHTWGNHSYSGDQVYHNQFEWKRSNAFGAKSLAENLLTQSLTQLASRVGTDGMAVYVYNPLNWVRDDVITIEGISSFPTMFEIMDDGKSIPYSIEKDNITFIASGVPPIGYKTFEIKAVDTMPVFRQACTSGDGFIENSFYKVIFAMDGTIQSICDKAHGNREIVDGNTKEKFNQYQYYDDFGVPFRNMGVKFSKANCQQYTPKERDSVCHIVETPIGITMELHTGTFRAGSIRQKVTLYHDSARIDISNEVVKAPLPKLTAKEEAFYVFPFKTSNNYEIRYDLPVGNTVEGAQVYGTSTDWYTANKWINVHDKTDDYSMTLAIPNTALVQFGERRTGKWSFDYHSQKPYIFSYVFNNMWQTNFQGDQPGYAKFNYSISTGKGEELSDISQFGWNCSVPLQASLITKPQPHSAPLQSSYLNISSSNVILTTMKAAEANGDGMIVRFAEIAGKDTNPVTVTLPQEIISSIETDIIENDIGTACNGNTLSFHIPPYGFQTFRIKTAQTLAQVQNVTAYATSSLRGLSFSESASEPKQATVEGTQIMWQAVADAQYYEIFRMRNEETPRILATTKDTTWFDTQIAGALCEKYRYAVRACGLGKKGTFSDPIQPVIGLLKEDIPPETPVLSAVPREKTRVDLFWTPVKDCLKLSHYEIYRDGVMIGKTTDAYLTTYRDRSVLYPQTYRYRVKAVGINGNVSESREITVEHKDCLFENSDQKIAARAKGVMQFFSWFGRR